MSVSSGMDREIELEKLRRLEEEASVLRARLWKTDKLEVEVEVGERIRRARTEAGVSLPQLAEGVGMHAGNLCHYEAGRKPLGVGNLVRIARFLGRSPSTFLPDDGA